MPRAVPRGNRRDLRKAPGSWFLWITVTGTSPSRATSPTRLAPQRSVWKLCLWKPSPDKQGGAGSGNKASAVTSVAVLLVGCCRGGRSRARPPLLILKCCIPRSWVSWDWRQRPRIHPTRHQDGSRSAPPSPLARAGATKALSPRSPPDAPAGQSAGRFRCS